MAKTQDAPEPIARATDDERSDVANEEFEEDDDLEVEDEDQEAE